MKQPDGDRSGSWRQGRGEEIELVNRIRGQEGTGVKQRNPVINKSRALEDLHHVQLIALLRELLRDRGIMKTAEMLGVDYKTVRSSMKAGRLSERMRSALGSALQEGFGSAAARQRERNDQLEARLDKMEGQLKEVKKELQGDLKRFRMSLDGVRKYYGVQRWLFERRLSALEAGQGVTGAEASAGGDSVDSGPRSVAADATEEMQIIVSVREGRATIGVHQPSSAPYIETLDDADLSELARDVAMATVRAKARWEAAPKHPV